MRSAYEIPGKIELCAENVRVAYGNLVAFRAQQMHVQGRIIGIIGHNGSGKSTLIKALLKLLLPRSGSIETYWKQGDSRTPMLPERDMAFSPENGAIFEDMPVESYIKLWCRIKNLGSNYYKKEGCHYLERLNITPLLTKLGRELSKGQRRRVQAAVGFLIDPRVFLFDEPFDGLDILQSNQLASIMLKESRRMSMIISSHRMEVIERLADVILVLKDGEVFIHGGVDEVCKQLGGSSFIVSNSPDHQLPLSSMLPLLEKEFYSCLINSIGNQLLITGNNIDLETLRVFFLKERVQGIQLHTARPSLVDAMRCHLRNLN